MERGQIRFGKENLEDSRIEHRRFGRSDLEICRSSIENFAKNILRSRRKVLTLGIYAVARGRQPVPK